MSAGVAERARAMLAPARTTRGVTTRPIAPHIALAVVRDADAAELVAADDARVAHALAATARDLASTRAREDGGVARIDAPFASALPLTRTWLASAMPGAARALVCAPSRDTLLFAVDLEDDVVARLAERAERAYHAAPHPVSPAIYEVQRDATLVPFRATGALANATALGHALLAMSEYEAQRAETDGAALGDACVAACELVFRRDDGVPITVATWGEGVTTLLPRADIVVLAGGDPRAGGWRFAVRWADLEARVGASCWALDAGSVPARVRTTAWPDGAALRALYEARDDLLARTASPPG